MRRLYTLLLTLLLLPAVSAVAQEQRMYLLRQSGEVIFSLPVSEVDSVTFATSDGDKSCVVNGHSFIDLGLPSGTLWASCNVGAESDTEDGDFFPWGEAKPNKKSTERTAKWHKVTYPYDVLSAEDDAATAQWGAPCSMPTKADVVELLNTENTRCTWTDDYNGSGVKGYIVESVRNGNKVFFSASGIYYNGRQMGQGTYCMYWTSTPYAEPGMTAYVDEGAWKLTFVDTYQNFTAETWGFRSDASSVRAVVH